jgi:hypothetical protein
MQLNVKTGHCQLQKLSSSGGSLSGEYIKVCAISYPIILFMEVRKTECFRFVNQEIKASFQCLLRLLKMHVKGKFNMPIYCYRQYIIIDERRMLQ